MSFGVWAFFALDNVVGEDAFEREAEEAFFPLVKIFQFPWDVPHVFGELMVGERHTDFEAVCHGHSVFALEKAGAEPMEADVEKFAAARFFLAFAL